MSNSFCAIVNLGKPPELLNLGGRDVYKLRCAEKASNKKSTTNWFTTLVSGPDVNTASRLASGDTICITGELSRTEYPAKKARYKGEMLVDFEVPFGKIQKVIKSPTFFTEQAAPVDDAPAGDSAPDIAPPDLEGL